MQKVYQQSLKECNHVDRKNFGGSMFLAVKNYKNNKNTKTASYQELGFDIIDEHTVEGYDDTLVKMVRANLVLIHSVITKTNRQGKYLTIMDIENKCAQIINAFIPKGSVVGEQDSFRKVQNLCTKKDNTLILEPHQRKEFKLPSFCTDWDYACPDGEKANFTPFVYRNMPEDLDQDSFWNWADQFRDVKRLSWQPPSW